MMRNDDDEIFNKLTVLLRSFKDFNFIDIDLSQRMNFLGLLFDFFTNIIINKFSNKRFNIAIFNLLFNSLDHLLPNQLGLSLSRV